MFCLYNYFSRLTLLIRPSYTKSVMQLAKQDIAYACSQCCDPGKPIFEFDDINKLAKIGNDGRWSNNCNRDLKKALAPHYMAPLAYRNLPIKKK